ncbi:phosphatidylinositol N-acetylglucosaminyltransferase subunit H-like [Physella acuta]|uniref:phosphatidylinositol N-acetylglucosaminyltransferase subunit H-like n=1 Tax=Physella acuta TaxID=109671 RepID=UPI0027DDEF45|nr:phosphatidylinositol N-acetylglucosaminyltransferase subunit H-like [Physella acuta]XP_059156200.1 phosphatidylinositol N-acetylglucosaminyltransferase subunit H-like [Physella acuta]
MVLRMYHRDHGDMGSEFTVVHPPLKSRILFTILLVITLILAFSFRLHMLDRNILASLCLALATTLVLKLYSKIHSENVVILPSLGLQVETLYYLGHRETNFFHVSHIKDVVINEAISMHSILHYLLVLLKQDQGQALHPLFSRSWPPLGDLKPVYKAAQEKLIRPQGRQF